LPSKALFIIRNGNCLEDAQSEEKNKKEKEITLYKGTDFH